MTDLSPDEQALFEAWALARGLSAADNHGQYRSGLTYLAAAAWSACLAAKREVWQPIETAPKDGTRIVVANKCGSWIAEYRPVYQSGFKPRNPWQSMMLNHDHMTAGWAKRDYLPTHWMPLPNLPALSDAGVRRSPI